MRVVIEGTWWVSTSNVYDPDHNTVPYPKGSVLTDLVKGMHYDGAKPETGDATIAIFMDCPLDRGAGRSQEALDAFRRAATEGDDGARRSAPPPSSGRTRRTNR